jgi:CubicO group peptidase (beta-lactamase class C family)
LKKIVHFLIAVLSCLAATAQDKASIDTLMQYCHTTLRFNGIVLVASGDNVFYKRAFGKANEENKTENKIDTKFRLGSLSKQFTAFAVLQLVEKRGLSLNDRVSTYISILSKTGKGDITVGDLLRHTSGLMDYTQLKKFDDQMYYRKDSIARMIAAAPLLFKPGTAYSYSNSNYFLLGLLIEKLTGKNFKDVLNEMVLKKAGMQQSGEDVGKVLPNGARGYVYRGDSAFPAPYIEMKNTEGGGGMYSTAEDLFKWSVFFQRSLAKDTLLKNMIHPSLLPDGIENLYSCGWCCMPGFIFHTGHINGFANLLAIDTIHHQTIILLTNHDYKQLYITMESLRDLLENKITANNWMTNKSPDLKKYNGNYSIGGLTVHIQDSLDYLEGTAFGETHLLRWHNEDEFFFVDQEGTIYFEKDDRGKIVGLKSFQDYSWVSLKKQ